MTFGRAVRTCLRKYVTFSGRASRPEYWWFVLFLILGGLIAGLVDALLFPQPVRPDGTGPLSTLFSLGTLIPTLSAGWRRMHDTGRSGLYLFYPLIVMVGIGTFAAFVEAAEGPAAFEGLAGIVLALSLLVLAISPLLVLWWLTRPSEPEPNAYGPPPAVGVR